MPRCFQFFVAWKPQRPDTRHRSVNGQQHLGAEKATQSRGRERCGPSGGVARSLQVADGHAPHSRLAIQPTALSRDMAGFFKRLLRNRLWQAFRFGASFFVQGFCKFLQAGNDLRRLGQDRRGQFFGIIWPALRHFRKRHHHGEGVIHGMLDLAVLGLELFQLFMGNAARFFTHCASISVEKVNPCA